MNDTDNGQAKPETPAPDRRQELFYARAIPRMLRTMLVAGVLLLVPAFWFYGWAGALGFAAGAAVSHINFLALARGVEGLAERMVDQHSQEKGRKIVLRFLVRYGLVGAAAYVIFKSSAWAFRGFLWGLCLPVAALMIEAGFEACAAFRREQ
jgi:hypothetical protein